MSKLTIVEGNSNDKDNVRTFMVKGEEGKSAYDIYVENGGTLTEEEWTDAFLSADNYYSKSETNNLLNKKINTTDIVDNLTSTSIYAPLSANQGKVIKKIIDDNKDEIENTVGNISIDVEQSKIDMNILSSRMDTFTQLPSGSTSGDAELIDIRVGADGVTYSSAGNSVRSQYDALHNTDKFFDMYEINLLFTRGFIKPSDLTYGTGGDHLYSEVFLLPAMSILHYPIITRSTNVCAITECDVEGTPIRLIQLGATISESTGRYLEFITTEDIYIRVAGNDNEAVKDMNHFYISKFTKNIVINKDNFNIFNHYPYNEGAGGLTSNSSSIAGYIHTNNIFLPKGFTIEFWSAGNNANWALSEWDYTYTRVRNLVSGNGEIQHIQYTSDKNQYVRLSGMTTPVDGAFNDIIPYDKWTYWKIYYKGLYYDKNNILYGKKLTVMGDSLIYGNRLGNGATWITNVGINNNMTYVNLGDNGNPVAEVSGSSEVAMVDRIDTIPTDTNYFVLLGGANDKRLNVPLGDINSTDKTTFYGALNTIIAGVRTRCPKTKILLLTTYNRFASKNTYNLGDIDYAEAMIQAGRNNLVPVFDNFHNSGVDFLNSSQVSWIDESRNVQKLVNDSITYIDDTHHFSIEGYEWITPIYENLLKGL